MSYLIPDDPIIRCMERTGMPPWYQEDPHDICPICGEQCETIYTDSSNEVVGCDNCLKANDVYSDWRY